MLESSKQQFLDDFMNEFNVAKHEVNSWSQELKEDASKTGVLTFPRNQETPRQKLEKNK